MSGFFLFLFDFFSRRKALLLLIVVAIAGMAVFLSSRIRLEENISRFLPRDEKLKKVSDVLEQIKTSEKLIITVSLADTAAANDPAALIAYADELAATLKNGYAPALIKDISCKISADQMQDVYDAFYEKLPLFLDEADYKILEQKTGSLELDSALARNFRMLVSPAGFVMKKFITRDPLGFTGLALRKLASLKVDDSYMIYNDHIFSKTKDHLLIFINTTNPPHETSNNANLIKGVDAEISKLTSRYGGKVKAEYYGAAAVAVGNASQMKRDSLITLAIALVLLVIFLGYFFRSKKVLFLILLPVLSGALFAMAAMYLIRGEVSTIAIGAGSVILGIAINYSLHFFVHYRHLGSVRDVIKDLAGPMTIGSTTTIGAFLGLMMVRSEALSDFGLFSALCLIGSVLFVLIVLPFMVKRNRGEAGTFTMPKVNFIDRISEYGFEKNKMLLLIIGILTVVFFWFARDVQFESDMSKMNYISAELKHAEQNLVNISDSSIKSIYLVSTGKTRSEALKNNEQVTEAVSKLKASGLVNGYYSAASLLYSDSLQKKKLERWAQFWTPERKARLHNELDQAAEKSKFRQGAFNQFYELLDTRFTVMDSTEQSKLQHLFLDDFITEKPGKVMVALVMKINERKKAEVLAALPVNENLVVVDKQYVASRVADIISGDFNTVLYISSLLVLLFLFALYGRVELGILAFIPMLISWVWILGLMAIFGLKFNVVSIIISAFIFGLGDDFSIFIMDGLLTEYKTGKRFLASYKTAVFLSAVTTIIGVGVLIFAKHPALRSIALLTIIGMISVVLISYTVAPVIFRWMIYKGKEKRTMPVTLYHVLYAVVCYSYFILGCAVTVLLGWTVIRILPVKRRVRKLVYHTVLMYVCRSTMYLMYLPKKKIINFDKNTFAKPAMVVCNHQSLIDIPLTLMFSPKVIMLTNESVWRSPLVGFVVRLADFLPTSLSHDEILTSCRQRISEGYSILVFPEGTRSQSKKLGRFHKGAFYLAEELGLDILPMVMNGTGDYIAKGEYLGRKSLITVKFLDRIKQGDAAVGGDYRNMTKYVQQIFKSEFEDMLNQWYRHPAYFRDLLIRNYIYKGPVLEGYARIKLRFEKNYEPVHAMIPLRAKILDMGCGYGFMSYMLGFLSEKRIITGIDYDEEKIQVAQHNISALPNLHFEQADVTEFPLDGYDVYLLSDVLHYMPEEKQKQLVASCIEHLSDDGCLIIRDADTGLAKRQRGTALSEFFSTNIGFNKAKYDRLFFTSREMIASIAATCGAEMQIIDKTKFNSNIFYLIRKSKQTI